MLDGMERYQLDHGIQLVVEIADEVWG